MSSSADAKPAWQSRTVAVNVVALLGSLVPHLGLEMDQQTSAAMADVLLWAITGLAGANLGLRAVTKKPIRV